MGPPVRGDGTQGALKLCTTERHWNQAARSWKNLTITGSLLKPQKDGMDAWAVLEPFFSRVKMKAIILK